MDTMSLIIEYFKRSRNHHLLDNLAILYMLRCDMQKCELILQSNLIINILASKIGFLNSKECFIVSDQ